MQRPITTLFMLSSVDGKISIGNNDSLDFDKDLPKIKWVKEGLNQYYKLEQKTDLFSLNSGRVMAKIGMNKKNDVNKLPVSFIIIDSKHLTKIGVNNLLKKSKRLFLVTTNMKHPAFNIKSNDLEIIYYKKFNFKDLFNKLKFKYGINNLTIQSGGTLNSIFLREGLIDYLSLVTATFLVGGKNTSSLIDGESLHSIKEISKVKALKLQKCEVLKNSYLHSIYEVINKWNTLFG